MAFFQFQVVKKGEINYPVKLSFLIELSSLSFFCNGFVLGLDYSGIVGSGPAIPFALSDGFPFGPW